MRSIFLFIFSLTTAAALAGGARQNPTGALTLRETLRLVLAQNPELAAFDAELRVADARILQARLRPNPEIRGELENLGGSGEQTGRDSAERTVQLSQLLELGGKRDARTRVATKGRELAQWDYDGKRLEVLTETAQVFIDVLTAQARVELVRQNVQLAESFLPESRKRVEAGRASAAEKMRGEIDVQAARIELEKAERELGGARELLVSFWGEETPRFRAVLGDLDHTEPAPPSAARLAGQLLENPQIARAPTELAQRRAQVNAARAEAAPDLTLSAGYRRFAANNDQAAVLGFSVPLPLFDRNQGGIREAQAQLEQAHRRQAATTAKLDAMLSQTYLTLLATQREIAALQEKILPFAEEAYTAIDQGYGAGRFGFLDLLEARRTLTSSRLQLLEAKRAYHRAVAEIEGLTGRAPTLHLGK